MARPILAIVVVSALLWAFTNSVGDYGSDIPGDAPELSAQWDGRADVVFSVLVQCLYDISVVTDARAAALHPQARVPNIEHWYRDRCLTIVDEERFRLFLQAYGLRAAGAVRRILVREADLVVLAVDDPLLTEHDVVAFWRAAAGRAALDLEYFRRGLDGVFDGLDEMPVLDPSPAPPTWDGPAPSSLELPGAAEPAR